MGVRAGGRVGAGLRGAAGGAACAGGGGDWRPGTGGLGVAVAASGDRTGGLTGLVALQGWWPYRTWEQR